MVNIYTIMFCPHCGAENSDSATFCSKCGRTFSTEIEKNTKPVKTNDGSKSMILAMIISFIFTGLGIAYAGDVKKGVIYFVIGIVLNILYMYVSSIFGIFVFIFWIYALYATYKEVKGEPVSPILAKYL